MQNWCAPVIKMVALRRNNRKQIKIHAFRLEMTQVSSYPNTIATSKGLSCPVYAHPEASEISILCSMLARPFLKTQWCTRTKREVLDCQLLFNMFLLRGVLYKGRLYSSQWFNPSPGSAWAIGCPPMIAFTSVTFAPNFSPRSPSTFEPKLVWTFT